MVNGFLRALQNLRDILIFTLALMFIFAVVGLQLYRGALMQKCVIDLPERTMDLDKINEWYTQKGNFYFCIYKKMNEWYTDEDRLYFCI